MLCPRDEEQRDCSSKKSLHQQANFLSRLISEQVDVGGQFVLAVAGLCRTVQVALFGRRRSYAFANVARNAQFPTYCGAKEGPY